MMEICPTETLFVEVQSSAGLGAPVVETRGKPDLAAIVNRALFSLGGRRGSLASYAKNGRRSWKGRTWK